MKRKLAVLAVVIMAGCKTIEITPPVIKNPLPPEISIPTSKPVESKPSVVSCGCDLTKPISLPPYSDSQLATGGNAYECPTIAGRDVRLGCIKPQGDIWLLGNLLPNAVGFPNGRMVARCFDADGGRYHYIGFCYNDDRPQAIVKQSAGTEFDYKTTTFVWFEFRK